MITLTDTSPAITELPTIPGATYALIVNPVGTGTVTVTDANGDELHADLTAAATLQRFTFDAANGGIQVAANGPDGTTAHEITLTKLI